MRRATLLLLVALPLLGQDRFSLSLFRELRSRPGNVVVAPVGIAGALHAAEEEVSDEAAREIRTLLAGETGAAPPGVINVSRIKAFWRSAFGPTSDGTFHLSGGGDAVVPLMFQSMHVRYANVRGGARLLELPYERDGLTMLIVLPDERDGLPAVEASLTSELLASWTGALGVVADAPPPIPFVADHPSSTSSAVAARSSSSAA